MDSSPFRAGGPTHPSENEVPENAFSFREVKSITYIDLKLWHEWRRRAYETFRHDIEIGYMDSDIIDLIELIFTKKSIFTISSCSGRILIIDALYPWLRDEAYIVFKKHQPIEILEVQELLLKHIAQYRFWLIASGPIFHFVASSLDKALELLKLVRNAGFKHSGIISVRRDGIVVEVISGTWTSFLLKERDAVLIDTKFLSNIVRIANEILIEGKKRLEKLKELLLHYDI